MSPIMTPSQLLEALLLGQLPFWPTLGKLIFTLIRNLFALGENWLELAVFLTVAGSTPFVHARIVPHLTKLGMKDEWYIWVAVLAIDLIIVGSASWGVIGLVIAFLICLCNILIALGVAAEFAPAMFSFCAFLGTLGGYIRREIKIHEQKKAAAAATTAPTTVVMGPHLFLPSGQLDPSQVKHLNADQLRDLFSLSHARAKELFNIIKAGRTVDSQWLSQKSAASPRPAGSP